jgi:hypothetical protein
VYVWVLLSNTNLALDVLSLKTILFELASAYKITSPNVKDDGVFPFWKSNPPNAPSSPLATIIPELLIPPAIKSLVPKSTLLVAPV